MLLRERIVVDAGALNLNTSSLFRNRSTQIISS